MAWQDIVTFFRFKSDQAGLTRVTAATRAAEARLRSATAGANRLGGALSGMGGRIAGMVGLGAVTGLAAGVVPGIIDANVEFGNLRARLETIAGSSAKAKEQFAWIAEFAAKTPFSIQQVTAAFTGLSARGLDVSGEAMTSLGDLAAKSGKDIGSLMEGMTGVISRGTDDILQGATDINFSIKGNKVVATTLSGVTTELDRSYESLQKYLIEQGKAPGVAGGMARQSATLGGQLSNMKDLLWQAAVAVGEAGLTQALIDGTQWVQRMTAKLKKWSEQGDNVRKLMDKMKNGAEALAVALALIGSAKVLGAINDAAEAIKALGTVGMWAQIKLLLIPAALFGIILLIDDIIGFTQGKDSVFGDMLSAAGIDPEPIRAIFIGVGETIIEVRDQFLEMWDDISEAAGDISWTDVLKGAIYVIVAVVLGLAGAIYGIIKILQWVGTLMGETAGFIVVTLMGIWEDFKGGGIGILKGLGKLLLFMLYAPLAPLIILFQRLWSVIGDDVMAFVGKVGQFFVGLWDGIKSGASAAWDWISATTSAIGTAISDAFWVVIDGITAGFWAAIEGALAAFDYLYTGIAAVGQGIVDFYTWVWDSIVGAATWVYDQVVNLFSTIGAFVSDVFKGAIQTLLNVVESGFNAIASMIDSMLPDAIINELPGAVKSFIKNGVDLSGMLEGNVQGAAAPAPMVEVTKEPGATTTAPVFAGAMAANAALATSAGKTGSPYMGTMAAQAGNKTRNTNISGITVQVAGSVDMTAPEMQAAIQAGAEEALLKAVESTYGDMADAF